jgi:hypothetical protein
VCARYVRFLAFVIAGVCAAFREGCPAAARQGQLVICISHDILQAHRIAGRV